jgi:predicted AlkP superfamily pyrophosphatase or phosphodiesterase
VERGFVFVYLDAVDAACHAAGPGSAEATAATRAALHSLEQLVAQLQPGTLLAVTADHGHVAADPARCLYLNTIWPQLSGLLSIAAPAGSPRDVFLHVRPGCSDEVVGGLRERLGDRAIVEPIDVLIRDGLLGDVSDRLRRRLGDVAILPAEGHEAYWYEPPVWEQRLLGHHGGLSAEETHTYLGLLAV